MKKLVDHQKRVGIWIRVSTEDQVRGESPEHHERRARLFRRMQMDTRRAARGVDVEDGHVTDSLDARLTFAAICGLPARGGLNSTFRR